MENNFILYEEAHVLKKLGFNAECYAYYHNKVEYLLVKGKRTTNNTIEDRYDSDCATPLYQQAFKFFRDKYNYHKDITFKASFGGNFEYIVTIQTIGKIVILDNESSYEEAELKCLKKLIGICKNNINKIK